ncbi:MAG: lycopene cyclase family protein [Thermoflexibacteraceae bacterium]
MKPHQYDYIIAGGGCAGLSLLYHLLNDSQLAQKKILVIDKTIKKENDRTWCFWTDQATLFDDIVYKEWKNIAILTDYSSAVYPLSKYSYKVIRGIDFYGKVHAKARLYPNIVYCQATIEQMDETPTHCTVHTSVGVFEANYVFNSLFQPQNYSTAATAYRYLLQHFKGWKIRTSEPVFDTQTITMFDFRLPQNNEVRFVYTLPYQANEALVEFTVFGKQLLDSSEYDTILKQYIAEQLKISTFEIEEEEYGIIPMTDFPFHKKQGNRLCYIGTQGGASKPTTGYTFLNIQLESKLIVKELAVNGHPFYKPPFQKHFLLYDQLMLEIMQNHGGSIKDIFEILFRNNPIERVLKFLNNATHFGEDLAVMWSVPSLPFLKALLKQVNKSLFNSN